MAHITKAQEADCVKDGVWIGISSIWATVVLWWLQVYAMPGRIGYFIPALVLLSNMVLEDYYHQTVDIRKAAVLALLFGRLSPLPLNLFALRWISGCVMFGAFYLGALRCNGASAENANTSEPQALSFLPSFALALLADAVYHISGRDLGDFVFLPEIDAAFMTAWEIMPKTVCVGLFLLAVWFFYYGVRYIRARKNEYVIAEGIGFGDFLFLPLFTALLGWVEFSLLYVMALIVHLIRCFFARKGEDKGCP